MHQMSFSFNPPTKPKPADLWPAVCRFENVLLAYKKARRGKRRRDEVAAFELEREENLLQLQHDMESMTYQPGHYRQFTVHDKKKRIISAAPFRDRVLQHALMNVLEPLLDGTLMPHCYACRKGKGVHAAVDQYQYWAQRYAYVLKLDVKHYFPSVDHAVLKNQLAAAIDDPLLLQILARIIDSYPSKQSGKGIAIGNLTSQFFGNFYLRSLDDYIGQELHIQPYLRYVDDLIFLADDKTALWNAKAAVAAHLKDLKLELHTNKAQIFRCTGKVPLFGYQISRGKRWLQAQNGHAGRRRLKAQRKAYRAGTMTYDKILSSTRAWIGHIQHAQTMGLRTAIFSKAPLL